MQGYFGSRQFTNNHHIKRVKEKLILHFSEDVFGRIETSVHAECTKKTKTDE